MSMNATLRGSTNSRLAKWLTVLIFVAALPLAAQRYHITYTPNSQEGLMLQLIEDQQPSLVMLYQLKKKVDSQFHQL